MSPLSLLLCKPDVTIATIGLLHPQDENKLIHLLCFHGALIFNELIYSSKPFGGVITEIFRKLEFSLFG